MKILQAAFLIFIITLLISCKNRSNIEVTGQIKSENGNPIANAEVVVLCWYMHGIDDASFNKQSIKTDKNGIYSAKFTKGYQVDVASKYTGFNPNRSYNKLEGNKIKVDLKLSKSVENTTLRTLLNTDKTADAPFMRVRIYAYKGGTSLNFSNWETYGFDFSTMTITNDTLCADIWFDRILKEEQPRIIKTNRLGGIIPITYKEVNNSLLFEKSIAPGNGYLTLYKLQGNEAGFFVKCRDGRTFGKIILENSVIDSSGPDGKGGYIKEFGKNLSCLYQPNGTTNLTYKVEDIDLEDFLVDFRMN